MDNQEMTDQSTDGTEMHNIIKLGKDAYPSGHDGDRVETKASGILVIHDDGSKFLVVKETDGVPVESMDEEENENPQETEEESEAEEAPASNMTSDQALEKYMSENKE